MQESNNMELKISALPQNEGFARSVVAAFCVSANPTVDVINDVKTVVSEAVTNCIVHGYEKSGGDIMIEASLAEDVLTVSISDHGRGIKNVDEAMKDFFTTKPDEERSGLGFTIMKSFTDTLEVKSVFGGGTTVTMTKKLCVNA